jgi:zinc protease
MKISFLSAKSIIATSLLFISLALGVAVDNSFAQSHPEPLRESLLNGLRVLIWSQPNNPKVYIKLRIQSGAAFDPVGKTGTMALLSDMFFPEEGIKTFYIEELEGELTVTLDQDSITISASGNADEYDRIIGTLQSAIINTPINSENLKRLREDRLKRINETEKTPSTIADRAVLSRLFRNFPYSRPSEGERDALNKIDHVDLQIARDRFLKADNATLTVVGGVTDNKALRSLRVKLGSWSKGDRPIQQAFSQPDAPDAKTLIVEASNNDKAEIRLGVRGLARADNDYAASMVLTLLAQERLRAALPEAASTAFARHEVHALPGIFLIGANVPMSKASQSIESAKKALRELAAKEPNTSEFEHAKSDFIKAFSQQLSDTKTLADFYLDKDTFRIQASPAETLKAINGLKPSDIQRVAARLFTNATFASVAVGNISQLKDELAKGENGVEVYGEKTSQPTQTPQDDKKKPTQTLLLKPVSKP